MKTQPDCIPCLINMTLRMARIQKTNSKQEEIIMKRILNKLPKIYPSKVPPLIAKEIFSVLDDVMGSKDVYIKEKKESNRLALKYYPRIKKVVEKDQNSLARALKLAAAANIIDFGVNKDLEINKEIENILRGKNIKKGIFKINEFKKYLNKSSNIIFIADNAGETVFDRVLLEEMKKVNDGKNIYYVVKNKPVLNDALREDALFCGLDKVAKIWEGGGPTPGLILSNCSKSFRDKFKKADLIISKGHGNYESLSELKDKRIFFLLTAKCSVIARSIGCRINEINLFNIA